MRVYIKVHDPASCMCSFSRKLEVRIQQPDVGAVENPNTLIKPGANLFNSIYFLRKDGTMRNCLGTVLDHDEAEVKEYWPREKLCDLVALRNEDRLVRSHWEKEFRLFMGMLQWRAEILDR